MTFVADLPFPIGSADNLRMAVGRGCRDAGVPSWSPHDLRHRHISLLHRQGESWAEIGSKVGQRNLSVTADRYLSSQRFLCGLCGCVVGDCKRIQLGPDRIL